MKRQLQRWFQWVSLALLLLVAGRALAAEPAGVVLMVSGAVQLERAGQTLALREGQGVAVGDRLTTGSEGHAYLRFRDESLLILRPASTLEIEDYQFDPAAPPAARVRFALRQGVARTITGKQLQSNKDRFRLNTPLAAIGVRGTDFTTYAGPELVRVSVHQGGVVITPYGPGCAQAALGACEGIAAVEMYANHRLMLELRKGQAQAELRPADQGAPDKLQPPRNGEPSAGSTPGASAEIARNEPQSALQEVLAVEKIEAISSQLLADQMRPPVVTPPNIQLHWGRWARIAGQPAPTFTYADKLDEKDLVGFDSYFAILRDKGFELPAGGDLTFNLRSAEAWVLSKYSTPQPLAVGNASLTVDFDKRSFATQLDAAGNQQTWALRAAGDITRDGRLISTNQAGGNMVVRGALGGQQANEAAYVFQRTLDPYRQIHGVTDWSRR